ncbi:unnamed protein product [Rotaria sp. Silwood2]|nr:unnamed protein product [Rotaria sp. Silwood2]CAF2802163.1 unnamed protein product [Rotaria sp. Silwood2]CAF3000331.1 unnamed protein product [Rotaria sp. Silwood2]CAF3163040.1 unnamed protein product [Rotaria sp. Silwood2]CAF4027378.1 unnamed protein product [Rotaria sp. Silwood2]
MASSNNEKSSCSICGVRRWIFPCDGCHKSFCITHAPNHRAELTTQLTSIQQQCEHLQRIFNQHEKAQEHPLFSLIDVWEHDTIIKIQQNAQKVRDELRQIHDESNNQMKTIFNQFSEQIRIGRETDDYTEIELNQWKEQLINIKKQLETPCDIELIPDNNLSPIHLIKINVTKSNLISNISSFAPTSQLHEDTNNIECSCDNDELDKQQQSTIVDINDKSSVEFSESNEPNTVWKEEAETNLNLCDISSAESHLLLDPTKNSHLLFLQLSSIIESQIPQILNQLTDHRLQIFDQKEAFLNQLQHCEQIISFIDISNILSDEQNCLLDKILELDNVYYIYIRGIPSEDDDERSNFFRRYPKIKGMFENEQRLMVQWAIDTANEYKKTGDMYIEKGDKDNGRKCFEQGITLYKRLSVFLNEKRRIR